MWDQFLDSFRIYEEMVYDKHVIANELKSFVFLQIWDLLLSVK